MSVVIAAPAGSGALGPCLGALTDGRDDFLEILVVAPAGRSSDWSSRETVRWIRSRRELVPELWSDGIAASTGAIVALTTADHIPDNGWVRNIREAHARTSAAAIGGPISPPLGQGLVCWSAWFLRYSGLGRLREPCEVTELAGDNASYKRDALRRYAASYRDGFWEPAVHKELRASSQRLWFDPGIVVALHATPGLLSFLQQRFRHGTRFGRWRATEFSPAIRLAATLLSPLIPMIFLAKIVGRSRRLGRYGDQFALSCPALAALVLAWSLGEAWGYISAPWRQAASLTAPPRPLATCGCEE